MSYIGNAPPKLAQYGVESFNGGGTSFTLSKPATTATVLVFIDGVRQTPGDAYSVSGTTLTTTATTPSGTDNVTVQFLGDVVDFGEPSDDSVTSAKIADNAVGNSEMADDAVGVAELSATGTASSSTYLRGDNSWASISEYDDSGLQNDIAILGFKVAANGSLGKYDLVDQTIDDFQDASGIDASSSTNETRNASNYYSASGDSFVAKGGGAGGNRSDTVSLQDGADGGSGGGGGVTANGDGHTTDGGASNKNSYTGWLSYGNEGGQGQHIGGSHEGAGGGGSPNQSGRNSSTSTGGNGSTGYETGISGSSTYYGQGGPGAGNSDGSAAANGGASTTQDGAANTGRGGGAGNSETNAGDGGSGVMYIQYTPSGGSTTTDAFTSSGTWTVPASTTQADIFMIGGGGPGGSGGSGGGGGGGAVLRNTTWAVTPGQQWTVTIGAGGVASTSNSVLGTNGGDTSIAYTPASMTLVSNLTTAQATPTTGDIVMTYTDGVGTATVNTDLKAYVSRDDGTTWTQATLSSEGTTGGHTILAAHNVDISSQPSGTSMRYKIETLNQSASKETRIQAVSLGWS